MYVDCGCGENVLLVTVHTHFSFHLQCPSSRFFFDPPTLQIDRDGLFDHDEYVVAMFLCDAVIQKGRPIPAELPASVIPPRKRELVEQRKKSGIA